MTPKQKYLIAVLSEAPIRNEDEAIFKAELLLAAALEAKADEKKPGPDKPAD